MSHDEAAAEAERMFAEALTRLQRCADLLRGPMDASPEAMRTEMAVSRAIETLTGNCLWARRAK